MGLTITSSAGYAGLFAANKGTIKNLSVSGGKFDDINVSNVGIICGHNDGAGEIKNCHVQNSSVKANSYAGGIAGSNNGTISNCSVNNEQYRQRFSGIAENSGYNVVENSHIIVQKHGLKDIMIDRLCRVIDFIKY